MWCRAVEVCGWQGAAGRLFCVVAASLSGDGQVCRGAGAVRPVVPLRGSYADEVTRPGRVVCRAFQRCG